MTVVPVASAICEASVRCQISRYSDSSWLFSSPATWRGERSGVVGRIASWASWAFLTFESYCLGCGDRNCWPYSLAIAARTACSASSDSVDAVGAHVGDVAPLVQALGDAHHLRRRQAQLAPALLLQRARHERRLRPRAVRLLLDASGRGSRRRRARRPAPGPAPRRATTTSAPAVPLASKSLPVATRVPSTATRSAVNDGAVAVVSSMSQ